MRTLIFILLGVMCWEMALGSQDTTLNRVVVVERDYQPDIEQATKIKLQPEIIKEEVEPNPVVYSTYSTPLSVEYNLHPLQAAKTQFIPQPTLKGVLEGALGHRNTHLLFGYRITQKKKNSLDLYAKHDAYWGKDALSNIQLGTLLKRHFSDFDLYFGIEGNNEHFTYYGRNFNGKNIEENNILSQALWKMNTKIGLRSTNNYAVQYRVQTGYTAYLANNYAVEHQIRSHIDVLWKEDNHGAGINIYVQNTLYNDSIKANKQAFRMEPFYAFDNDKIRLHVGVNLDLNVGTGQQVSTLENVSFAPSPNVQFEWNMMEKIFLMYAQAQGSMGIGSLDEYMSYNRYLNINEGIHFQSPRAYTPVDAQLGFKIRPTKTMLLDVYAGYAYMLNACHMFARVDSTNHFAAQDFTLQLADYQRWKVGASLHYHYRDIVELNVSGNYYIWKAADNITIYDRPSWDAHARLDIHFDSKWSIYSDNIFAGGYKVATTIGDQQLRPTISLNFGGQYSVNNWLHVYLQLNNYLNRKNDIFYGYQSQGCHFLLGVKYKF